MSAGALLLIEDNAVNAQLILFVLEQEGYAIRVSSDANEALSALQSFTPDLILLDIQLPGMSGLDLARRLKADPLFSDVPIIALTAYAMKGDEEKARAAGCDGYVTKPVDTRALPGLIAGHIARRRQRSPGP